MTYTPEVSNVNQQVQIGAEATPGTAVPAGKLLKCFDWVFGIDAAVSQYRPTGNKYDATQEEDTEQTMITASGILDYNGVPYLLGSAMGLVSPVAHGVSATAKDWIYTPPVTGSIQPQTYSFEQGDVVRARKFNYGLLSSFGYKGTRKTPFTVSGKGFGQPLSDGITLTSSPTAVALAQAAPKQFNVYLDPTSAALGTTLLTRVLSIDYAFDSIYGPFFALNRTTVGYTGHVDLPPKTTFKIMLEADVNGMAPLSYLQAGTTYYLRVDAQGAVIDNLQTVTLGVQSTGTFTLTYKGQTTATIAYNAIASAVQSALIALSSIGAGNVTVTGSAGGPYSVVFGGTLAQDTTAMTGTFTGLTTPGNASIAQNQTKNEFKHDMAIKFGKPSEFKDDQGIFALEWECTIVQDPSWGTGQAQQVTVTNLITAL